eukprot:TRINITY_DN288_c0_g2_i1.p1 TRINITY_DN288_c0_g2~~TRINITY_DN288_c0_g2_i1.p1  ORF type:complete len:653 (+),score=273.84 TRINITY_DN288_c0_g2_i1:157-2115(+)
MADEAVHIGGSEAVKSYLQPQKIIDAALKTNAQAIHPGYGFLSESSKFSDLCSINNIEFIGPPVKAIESMGSKSASKEIMTEAKVPFVPGYHGEDQDVNLLKQEAEKIKYPVMIKAVMGGGGRGMRTCFSDKEFNGLLESAKRESANAFNDDRVLLERFIQRPRHIEVQVFADKFGNCVYLFERDCSIQRRNQKVVEEAPAPFMTEERRKLMGETAVNAAKAVGYVGAGTVEFIIDTDNEDETSNFYFMEMNTRLQVEHPVTELITNQDLVEWQILVAAGNELPLAQNELKINGHSMEVRVYAEDPKTNLPGYGKITHLKEPEKSSSVRVDTGVIEGSEISTYYDSMISKLIVWGPDRYSAIKKLSNALIDYQIVGLPTNLSFLKKIIDNPEFIEFNEITTNFIPENLESLLPATDKTPDRLIAIGAVGRALQEIKEVNLFNRRKNNDTDINNPFTSNNTIFRNINNFFSSRFFNIVDVNEDNVSIIVTPLDNKHNFNISIKRNDEETNVKLHATIDPENDNDIITSFHDNSIKCTSSVVFDKEQNNLQIFYNGTEYSQNVFSLSIPPLNPEESSGFSGDLFADMPSEVQKILVEENQAVTKGDVLIILYAMKTELPVRAPSDGIINKIFYKEKETVNAGDLLISLKNEDKE